MNWHLRGVGRPGIPEKSAQAHFLQNRWNVPPRPRPLVTNASADAALQFHENRMPMHSMELTAVADPEPWESLHKDRLS